MSGVVNRSLRVGVLLVESGIVTAVVTALALSVRRDTWLWEITKGGDRVAWFIPLVVAVATWLGLREQRLAIKRFSIGFHVLFVLLVLGAIVAYWIEPFPD